MDESQPQISTSVTSPATAPQSVPKPPETSNDSKTIVVILLLVFIFPIGVIAMWVWMKWRAWVKALVTILPIFIIGVLSVLLAITLIAINPAKQFAEANNTKRQSDVNAILNSIHLYMTSNSGQPPHSLTTEDQEISSTGANICSDVVPAFISSLPTDPTINNGTAIMNCTETYDTGYKIHIDPTDNRIVVTAPNAELDTEIKVTR